MPQEPLPKDAVRAHITQVLMARVSQDDHRRVEALRDYLAVTQAVTDLGAADTLALMVPPLMPSLYRRWIGMFIDRLLQTATDEQLIVLCDGSGENGGALALAFVMFLESERMERQMADDLRAFGAGGPEDAAGGAAGDARQAQMADLAASYLRARVVSLAEKDAKKQAEKDSLSRSPKKVKAVAAKKAKKDN